MNDDTISGFKLSDNLQRLESSLAQLQPSEMQSTSAELLFAAGLAAGGKRQANLPSNRRSGRWSSFTTGVCAGILASLISAQLFSLPIDSLASVKRDVHPPSVDRSLAADESTGVIEAPIVYRDANRGTSESYRDQQSSEQESSEQQIWVRVGRNDLEVESIDVTVKPVNFNYLTAHEFRKLASETL